MQAYNKVKCDFVTTLVNGLLILLAGFCSTTDSAVLGQAKVYRDKVTPIWFGDQTRFWYRNDLPGAAREYVVVEALKGRRQPAFDHESVARQLSELSTSEVNSEQLPVDSIEFTDDAAVLLTGRLGRFRWDLASSRLTQQVATAESKATQLFLPVRPSGASDSETEITLENQLDQPLDLIWISPSGGLSPYGSVKASETRRQHTFAGHVWLLRKSDGTDVGCFEAERGMSAITISQSTLDSVQTRESPRRGRGRDRRRDRERQESQNPVSPDGAFVPFARDNNLWLKRNDDNMEFALTTNATTVNTFRKDASRARGLGMEFELPDFPDHIVDSRWSPDSKYLLAFQTTQVEEKRTYYIESTPGDQLQPKLQSYAYFKPGDAIPTATLRLFRVADRSEVQLSNELFLNPWSLDFLRWSEDGTRFWLQYNERGHQNLRVLEVTVETGAVRALVDEHSDTFVHYSSDGKYELRWLGENTLLWASERTGWNHLYRYDLQSGQLLNAVTTGAWNVRRIEYIDEEKGVVWFFAVGVRSDQDPYHEHFCRVHLDGSDFRVLTDGDGTHDVEWSPDRRWFIDRFSRVDLPPISELRDSEGHLLCVLEEADGSEILTERGYFPERFSAKGRDGKTDIWGIVHRPKNFDSSQSYPVIENIYAGPHDHHVPKAFQARFGHQHQIADQGFIVVQIDGMGTAWRSREFHNVCFRNLRDAGFPDRILWMNALKEKVPQIDLERVGIYGGSAGGQNAMAALLWHGDFYKAAVADCGCHDNRMDKIWWNEQWMGVVEGDHYQKNSNMENAQRLQGSLMLVVGELDRNVDPATTAQVAKKLIDAGKDFDFVVVPGAGHGACETPWASKRRTAFFLRELRVPSVE